MKKLHKIPKLVVTDWDGTFSEQGSSPKLEVLNAKNQLIKNNSYVVLASGRSVKEVLKYIDEYNLSTIFIAELGTIIYFHGKEYINHGNLRKYGKVSFYKDFIHCLDDLRMNAHDAMFKIGIVDRILAEINRPHISLRIFTPKDGRPGEKSTNLMEKKGTVLLRGIVEIDDVNGLLEKNTPFLELKDNGLVEDSSGDHAYHLLIKGANKESAVLLIQKLLNIKENETIGFGDSLSDLSLTTVVNRFYLMKNGLDHTPDILKRFKKLLNHSLSSKETEQVMKKVVITKRSAGLGWSDVVKDLLSIN